MRAVSWFDVEPPGRDGARWVNEHHIVGGVRHDFRWLCHRQIDPQKEVERRAHDLSRPAQPAD